MSDNQVDQIKDTVSVPSILEALDIELPSRIPGHILCRFHAEDTPSLWIAESRWWCFGCGQGGDVIALVRHVTGCSFPQALRFLEGMGDLLDFKSPVIERSERKVLDLTDDFYGEAIAWYHIDADASLQFVQARWPHIPFVNLSDWGVRPGGRGRYLMIPHFTGGVGGVITGIKTRVVDGPHKGDKKAFTGSTYGELYSVEHKPEAKTLLLVEGESDTWTMTLQQSRNPAIQVAGLPSGAQSWKRYLPEMEKYWNVSVALDNDDTGERVSNDIIEELGSKASRLKPNARFKDWTEQSVASHV